MIQCAEDEEPGENLPSISINPRAVNLGFGQQQRFTATVTGLENTAVTWSLHEGPSAGTLDPDGLYTAPSVEGTYHVVAVSQADSKRSSSATVNVHALELPVAVSLSPVSARLTVGTTQQFTSTVTGNANTAVSWSVTEADGGTVSSSGLYTAPDAPGTYHVVATSVADATKSATATVTVDPLQTIISVSVEPTTATLLTGETKAFTATVTGTTNTEVTWSVTETGGGTVDTSGLYTAPGAAGTYHVVATSVADPSKKATSTVSVTARPVVGVSLNPTDAMLRTNGTQQFTATVTGTTNTEVTWSVTETGGGTVDASGLYTAPDTAGTYHVVATSVADSTKSATATVTVTDSIMVSVSPATAALIVGQTQQFVATVSNTSNNAVTWTIQEGTAGGTIDTAGLYTAPSTPGTYHVVATSEADPTKSATATITVTTPFPTDGLALHLSADQLLGPSGTLPADGATVSSWVDLSGNGRDLSQTEAVRQPLFKLNGLNGRPTVVFDGSATAGQGDYLRSDAFPSALAQPITLFFVYRSPNVGTTNRTLIDAPPSTGTNRIRVQATTVPVGALQLYSSTFTSPGTAKTAGNFFYVTAVYNGANTRLRANGANETLNNHDPGSLGMAGLMLGGRQDLLANAFAQTEFAELLVYTRDLSDPELTQIEGYLKNRYFP
ncbi:Ig-like domain-containing protein [Hyalangium versicolor]|uniref:Ig-like domain-containing protein n=1 Tax=Hyalangium versicolor TaxID=2861190 RepID=UPI001CCCE31E|nr:Ig-like domain-containing protein [Hyalangium versicolor]